MTKTNTNTNTTKKSTTTASKTASKTATATAVPTVEDYKKQVAIAELANEIVTLNERKKQLEVELADAKAKLSDLLPQDTDAKFIVQRTGDDTKKLSVGWGRLTRNTAKPELIVKNHGITLTAADFQTTDSTFPEVKVLKA